MDLWVSSLLRSSLREAGSRVRVGEKSVERPSCRLLDAEKRSEPRDDVGVRRGGNLGE